MRTLLVLICSLGLALFVNAAQPDQEQGNQQNKKKGGGGQGQQQQQVVTPQTGKKFKAGPGGGLHTQNVQQPSTVTYGNKGNKTKWRGPVTGQTETNVSGNAANTKFNKGKFSSQTNVAGGGKFQKKHFDLAVNKVNTKYKTVNFNANYRLAGAQNWRGSQYVVFRNYRPQWHDQGWWRSHHNHIVFIFGGWYFWDNYYWYPAWGYAPDSVYYYDGPIYASSPEEDPGQVVANVQSALQEQGYYQGEIDGVLGPQTRAALAEYQSAQGLEPTGAVDEPTLETLGMA
jgi:Putative peptidoglycan binding domain